jgi:[ribosomal protein S18]-alanine N-acetyltransferase
MILSRATLADLPQIAVLERDVFEHAGWSPEAWRDEIVGADRHVLVARDAYGAVVGVATFQVVADVADLHRVVVRPDQRGRGIGGRLVLAGIHWAQAHGAQRVLLEVEAENAPALALYEGLGFRPVGRRADYYGAGVHALVMELALREPDRSIA